MITLPFYVQLYILLVKVNIAINFSHTKIFYLDFILIKNV